MKNIKEILKNTAIYRPLATAKDFLKHMPVTVAMFVFKRLPVDRNKIVFSSYHGKKYSDEPKQISEYIQNQCGSAARIVWVLQDYVDCPQGISKVRPNSIRYAYELMTAKCWVDNCRKSQWIVKRKEQFYIQTWHGRVGLKAIEKDAEITLHPTYISSAIQDSRNSNYVVAQSEWGKQKIRSTFWYTGKIIPASFNTIRDIDPKDAKQKICSYFNFQENARFVLYVPTFRNGGNTEAYLTEYDSLLEELKSSLGGEWKAIVRLHPNVSDKINAFSFSNNVFNGTPYNSIEELICACDIIISDYSSCIFDGFYSKKYVILYACDYDMYIKKERSLYFNISQLPSPLVKSFDELMQVIKNIDFDDYCEKCEDLNKALGYYETSAAKVCGDLLIEQMDL